MSSPTSSSFYETLNISKNASPDEVKKAYRSLSMKWHPDRNSNPEAKEKFQEINAAYEVLNDPEKRRQYDLCGTCDNGNGNGGGGHPFPFPSSPGFPNDILRELFQHHASFSFGTGGGGTHFFAMGNNHGIRRFHPPPPLKQPVSITFEQLYHGDSNLQIQIQRQITDENETIIQTEVFSFPLSPGFDTSQIIGIRNKGHVSHGMSSDLYLSFIVIDHPVFKRDPTNPMNLVFEKTITLKESLCGYSFDVLHLNKEILHITNQSNEVVLPESTRLIPALGFPNNQNPSVYGELKIIFHVEFPKTMAPHQIVQLQNIL